MRLVHLTLTTFLAVPALHAQQGADPAPVLPHRDLQLALARTTQSNIVTRLLVGESRGGRQIEALRIAGGTLEAGRPAVLVVAGLEGPEAWTSGLALALARELTLAYETDPAVRRMLDTTTVYVVPRANPDACEARFARVQQEVRASGPGGDEDRDARRGEDPPQDVDGDGVIAWMRVPAADGEWLADEVDPRVLVRAEGTTPGRWRLVPEGLDEDGDGAVAEDPPLDVEVNRNFAAGFEEHTPRAGHFPTQEPATRALCDFVLAHRDVQLVLVYGETDDVADPRDPVPDDAPDVKRVPPTGPRAADAAFLTSLAERYVERTGDEAGARGDDAGTFSRWCAEHRGLWTLAIDPWTVPVGDVPVGDVPEGDVPEGAGPRPSEEARALAWLEARGVDAHLGWQPFEHPVLGPVEVGGFRPYVLAEPPAETRAALVPGQLAFVTSLGADVARLALKEVTYTNLGGGVLEVRATLSNTGRLPLLGVWARRVRATRPARVELALPEGTRLLGGAGVQLVEDLGGGLEHELYWLVRGGGAPTVLVDSDHAGRVRATCEEVTR